MTCSKRGALVANEFGKPYFQRLQPHLSATARAASPLSVSQLPEQCGGCLRARQIPDRFRIALLTSVKAYQQCSEAGAEKRQGG